MTTLPPSELIMLFFALLSAGVLAGLIAGIFGVGGGAVIVPLLYQLFTFFAVPDSVRMHLTVGTSLAIIVPTSLMSYRTHKANGYVLKEVIQIWALPVVLSVFVGALIAAFVSGAWLKIVFIAVALLSACKLLFGLEQWKISDNLPGAHSMRCYGILIGLSSSLMGVGGGVISNMIMKLHGQPIHYSVATSSGLGVLISIPGALSYIVAGWDKTALLPPLSLGYVSLLAFMLIAPLAAYMAPIGAKIAQGMSKRRLEKAFGIFLCLASARFIVSFF